MAVADPEGTAKVFLGVVVVVLLPLLLIFSPFVLVLSTPLAPQSVMEAYEAETTTAMMSTSDGYYGPVEIDWRAILVLDAVRFRQDFSHIEKALLLPPVQRELFMREIRELARHPNVERPQNPRWGVLSRVDDDELSFRYDFHLHRRTEHGYVHAGSWTMEITIHQEYGRVTLRLKEREDEALIKFPLRSNRTIAQGKTIWVTTALVQYRPFTVIIAGEGIKTAIDPLNPLGMVTWEHANHGWLLVGTDRGGLIIATTTGR